MKVKIAAVAAFIITTCIGAARAGDIVPGIPTNPERDAYYGDLHLHTSYSFDAYLIFGAQVDPTGAYRFARGEPGRYLDEDVRRSTPPLDFVAVTDHAEWIGAFNMLEDPNSALSQSEIGRELRELHAEVWDKLGWKSEKLRPLPGVDTNAIERSTWQGVIAAANEYYQPGEFTTFIAYEWAATPGGHSIHRNVIFCGNDAPQPFTTIDATKPENLWRFLETIRKLGCEALAIPHTPNESNGLMFEWVDSVGKPIDQGYAQRRAFNEPLVEISQHQGQSETHPALSPKDEFANFELLDGFGVTVYEPDGGYVRNALGRGLEIAQRTNGANPYKFGFIGSTDFHNGLSDSAESAYAGTAGAADLTTKVPDVDQLVERYGFNSAAERAEFRRAMYRTGSGSLTGVWAEQNTRESICAALRRKETFATSGPRLGFRFFGGWDFSDLLFKNSDWVSQAYRAGVPMGGDLPARPAGAKGPTFAMWAVKDPDGANLDRLQVVKMWLEGGKHAEKVYDVALSNGRRVDPASDNAPQVGNTVDLRTATYTNTIGAAQLSVVWEDPSFDPTVPAVYYLRVVEIPTPRWSTIVAVRRRQPVPVEVPATIQERGWSSPIWYAPSAIGSSL